MLPDLSPLFSRKEVADLLNVSTRTVARWELTGVLKPIRLSRRAVRYSPQEIQRFVADGQTQSKGAACLK